MRLILAIGVVYFFVDTQTGWVVGESGILKTTDAGLTWSNQPTGVPGASSFSTGFFINAQIGWVIGSSLLKTTDGGANWVTQTPGTGISIRRIYFSDAQTGWAVGNSGAILKTTNGGTKLDSPNKWYNQCVV
jgi:photosystem II stability/assembly factor-like uncharacterized protein